MVLTQYYRGFGFASGSDACAEDDGIDAECGVEASGVVAGGDEGGAWTGDAC
jgi:hypothetical protein